MTPPPTDTIARFPIGVDIITVTRGRRTAHDIERLMILLMNYHHN